MCHCLPDKAQVGIAGKIQGVGGSSHNVKLRHCGLTMAMNTHLPSLKISQRKKENAI